MEARMKCIHACYAHSRDTIQSDIESARGAGKCSECSSTGPNLWLCLYQGCHKIGCGEAHNDHSTAHNRILPNHCIHLNLSTQRVWCYRCEKEVFLESGDDCRTVPTVRYRATNAGDSGDSSDSEGSRDEGARPRGDDMSMLTARKETLSGLTGLQNIGNTCYMNSALQALSNTPPLTQFFLDCGPALVARQGDKKPGLSKSYHRLVQEMWHRKRPGYVVPSGVLYGIRNVHPMFRGYQQHDTQEFLRCFMDQLHEELKEPIADTTPLAKPHDAHFRVGAGDSDSEDGSSQSEGDEYETCDSGVSERSSLSEEGDRGRRTGGKRKMSRSPSPGPSRPRGVRGRGSPSRASRKKHAVKHRSIISDVFDGKLLSSVQCLTCDRVSTRVETFQDLSLPIPSRDHLHLIHQGSLTPQKGGLSTCSDVYAGDQFSWLLLLYREVYSSANVQGWVNWLWEWLRSWFWGPTVSLHDCLAAFFSADELKGDNMYSCERCNKLRNGVKYSKVLELPEVLCIHLKRFRHELMFSAKIGSYVTFPLTGLDMRPYMHKDCVSSVTSYELVSVICHHGTAGGGHYTCYSFNNVTERWFEFDDQYVTQVSPETVQTCEAYVLFYQKSPDHIAKLRSRTVELIDSTHSEPGLMQFYVSKQWVNKFNTFAEPGPIDNSDFLCAHGGVLPSKVAVVDQLCTILSQTVWEYLYDNFGGGPACNCLYECTVCSLEQEALQRRVKHELDVFVQLNKEFQAEDNPSVVFAIAMSWFRQWQHFVQSRDEVCEPPAAIDNSSIVTTKSGQPALKPGSDYAQLSEELWQFFHRVYGGGPALALRSSRAVVVQSPPAALGKARSTENLPSAALGAALARPARALSFSSDNIAARMAALSATGQKRLHDAASEQCLAASARYSHARGEVASAMPMKLLRSEGSLLDAVRREQGIVGREGDFTYFARVQHASKEDRPASSIGRSNPHDAARVNGPSSL